MLLVNLNMNSLQSLIEAEKSFSDLSAEKGIKTAFLKFLDDDAILFMPNATKGKKKYSESDSIPGNLTWEPQIAHIANSQKLGYTTGPWKLERNNKTSYGHFVSIWEKKYNVWKVILDVGIDYTEPYVNLKQIISSESKNKLAFHRRLEEKALTTLDQNINSSEKYNQVASNDFIFLRMGMQPLMGKEKTLKYINEQKTDFTVKQEFKRISETGDFAYSYGYFLNANNEKDSYVRIWTKSLNYWKLVLEVAKPIK